MFMRRESFLMSLLAVLALCCLGSANLYAQQTLSVSPDKLTFYYQIGSALPGYQDVAVSSTTAGLAFTSSVTTAPAGTWLSVAPPQWNTPGSVRVGANPIGMAAGTYNGTVIIASAGAANTPVNVPVTMIVSTNPLLILSQSSLSFTYQIGDPAPAPQTFTISSSGAQLDFAVATATSTGVPWLNVVTGGAKTATTATVSVNPAFVPLGSQTGTITITSAGASNSPQTVTVSLAVSAPPFFTVAPGLLNFNYQVGTAAPAEQTLDVVASKSDLSFTVTSSTSSGGDWLVVYPTAWPTTPSRLSVRVNPGTLAPGTYNGLITVNMPGASNTPQTVAVALTIAASPVMTVSPGALSFYFQSGTTAPDSQTLTVSSSGGVLAFNATAATAGGGNWLTVTPGSGATPGTISVAVNPANLALGTYNGAIRLDSAGASNSPQTVAVTLVVSATPLLTVAPSTLTFNYQVTAAVPAAQVLTIKSSGTPLGFIATTTVSSGGNWLAVNPAVSTTPGTLSVAVNPVGLPPGNYTGTITIAAPGASNSPQNVAVTMVVSNNPFLTLTPTALTFNYQIGGSAPAAQPVLVSGTSITMSFTAAATTTSGGNWLGVNPASGAIPAVLNVSVNASGLLPGTYTGSIAVNSPGAANTPQTMGVTLIVSANPVLNITPASLAFSYTVGGAAPAAQGLVLTSSAGPLSFAAAAATTSGGNWLAVAPASGATPGALSATLNVVGLLPGTYEGSIAISASGQAAPQIVPVTFTVLPGLALASAPSALTFNHQVGTTPPPAQTLKITSNGASLNFTASASTSSGANWLAVTPASGGTPGNLSASINPAGLALGTYNGTITVVSAGATNSPLTVPVTLVVSSNPFLQVSATTLAFAASTGGAAPPAQGLTVLSTGTALNVTTAVATTTGGNWLSIAPPGNGPTPLNLSVAVNAAALPVGNYEGTVTITSPGVSNSPVRVAVTLAVSASVNLASTPATLNFSYQVGAAAPSAQTLNISTSGASVGFTATASTAAGGGWLAVTPSGAATPGTLSVSVNATGLAPATYNGTINITSAGATNSPFAVPVTLVVTTNVNLAATPGALAFNYQIGAPAPDAQKLNVASSGAALSFTASAAVTSGGSWLAVSPTGGGTTPATLNVSINTAGLVAGIYAGAITIAAPQAANTPQTVNVSLTVTAAVPPVIAAVVNAASWVPGRIAPGEIITIGTTDAGPAALTKLQLDATGKVATVLAETRILFDGVPGPLIYVSKTQSSVIVPYTVAGRAEVQLQVEYKGVKSNPIRLLVADTAPGVFTQDASGRGPGAILNQDFKLNTASVPAERNSIVMIYATGEGQTDPAGVDGSVAGAVLPKPLLPVTVQIGGKPAEVSYQGGAPSSVAGLIQINAKIPPDVAVGNAVPVVVIMGGVASQSGVTMAVK